MEPHVTGKRKIKYSVPVDISLFDYLRSRLTKNHLFVVFAQFVEYLKMVEIRTQHK